MGVHCLDVCESIAPDCIDVGRLRILFSVLVLVRWIKYDGFDGAGFDGGRVSIRNQRDWSGARIEQIATAIVGVLFSTFHVFDRHF